MANANGQGKGRSMSTSFLITLAFALVYFYFKLPSFNLHDPAFYTFILLIAVVYCFCSILTQGLFRADSGRELWDSIKLNCAVSFGVCVVLAAVFIVGSIVSSPVIRARSYRSLLTVEQGDFSKDIPEISFDQIPMLDADSARKLGDKKMGELANMVSQFEVADDYTQINYKSRPVRVTPLAYGDFFKWAANVRKGLPAYIVIDMVTQKAEAVRLQSGMKYSQSEYFFRNVNRHLRFRYPTFIFDTPNFEIDDEGTPYWVCPRIVKRIGLFGGTDIEGAVLMNAVTGKCEYCADVPEWVDRVYSAELIMQQYDYYGMYQNGWLNSFIGQKGVSVTTEGYNYIARDDDVYMYTGITSVASDGSNIGFLLTNQRTKETKYYACAGAQEVAAKASAEGIVQYMDYKATFPLLLNISNQPTYFMALKDSEGLVKMYAMVNVQQYQLVASGTTVSECEKNYVNLLAGSNLSDESKTEAKAVKGTIAELRSAVVDGNTNVYIKLTGGTCWYILSVRDNELAAVLSAGDSVEILPSTDTGELRAAYSVRRLS